jgi:glyoxylase I family protein
MDIIGTHHVAICTPNFETLKKFYIETLGLKQVGRFDGRNIIFVQAGTTTIEIVERKEPLALSRIGWAHFAFEVKDIAKTAAELIAKGITFHIDPKLVPETNPAVKLAFFKDPDGNELELVEPLATKYPNETA